MTRARFGRLGTAVAAASLVALQVFSGFGQAATPAGWYMTVIQQPDAVASGDLAGFEITIGNRGPSNISQFFFVDSPKVAPDFVSSSRPGICSTQGNDLKCNLSPLNAGQEVTIVVGYKTGTSAFVYTPEANTTGVPPGDNRSHGDSLFATPQTYTTTIGSGRNFGAKFLTSAGGISNDTKLTGPNNQSVQLLNLSALIGASVQDGLANDAFSCGSLCTGGTFLGEWTKVYVDGGQTQTAAFKAVITIKGAATDDVVYLAHVQDNGSVTIIGDELSERCPDASTSTSDPDGCVITSNVGNNLQIVAWLYHNGGMRGFG